MAKLNIYLPDELAVRLDTAVRALTAGGRRVSRSEVIQEALRDYLAEQAAGGVRAVRRTYAQREQLDGIIYEMRALRRSLRAREGHERVADGQHIIT